MTPALAQDSVTRAEHHLAREYEDLAAWCHGRKLFRERDRLYERVLLVDPENAAARKWLKYKKRDGKWERARPYKRPRNFKKDQLPAFHEKRKAIQNDVAQRLLALVDDGGAIGQRALAAMVRLLPEHPEARARNDEVKRGGKWVLRESAVALERRASLRAAAGRALRDVAKPRRSAITAHEKGLRAPWAVAMQGHWWRCVATTTENEVRNLLRACDASANFIGIAIPDRSRPMSADIMVRYGFEMYVLDGHEAGMALVDSHPAFTATDRKYARDLGGSWVPKSRTDITWGHSAISRLDAQAKTAAICVLEARYTTYEGMGWITEGFGFYLAYPLVGTRLTTFVNRSRYANNDDEARKRKLDLWSKMQHGRADWLSIVRELKWPDLVDLRLLMRKKLNHMDLRDVLVSYAIAAYFVEGRPDDSSQFLARMLSTKDIDKALADCNMTFPQFSDRVKRWLRETK